MKYTRYYLPLLLLIVAIAACKEKHPMAHQQPVTRDTLLPGGLKPEQVRLADSISAHNCRLVADTIMPKYKTLVKYYFRKYRSDTCMTISLDSTAFEDYDGVQPFGCIRLHQPPVAVFVCPRINWCDTDGDAYYFTDTTLPRLETETVCSHPQCLFPVADIDEDGISEIGLYFTSCVSHYKSLHVYSLKNGV